MLILTVTLPLPFDTHCCSGPLSLVAGLQSAEEGDSIARLPFEFPVADQFWDELRLFVQAHATNDPIQPARRGRRKRREKSGGRRGKERIGGRGKEKREGKD